MWPLIKRWLTPTDELVVRLVHRLKNDEEETRLRTIEDTVHTIEHNPEIRRKFLEVLRDSLNDH